MSKDVRLGRVFRPSLEVEHRQSAETITKVLGGRKVGSTWMVRCPAHDDREPSLSIRDSDEGRVLVHCHGGCDQERVIATLRARGQWAENGRRQLMRLARRPTTNDRLDPDVAKRTEVALAIWQAAIPAAGAPVETYLASRGLDLPTAPTLRFHAGLKHPSGSVWPAMVALVTSDADNSPLGIHRTFIARDGSLTFSSGRQA